MPTANKGFTYVDPQAPPDVPATLDARLDEIDAAFGEIDGTVDEAVTAAKAAGTASFSNPDVLFTVVDEDGRRTWLEVAPDGGPTEHAAEKIGAAVAPASADAVAAAVGVADQDTNITGLSFAVVDEDGRRTWLEADEAGAPTPRAAAALLSAIGLAGVQAVSGPAISCIGDSMTAGTGGTPYPTALATLTGRTVHNLGVGGESSRTIAGRAGARPWLATIAGGSIPASGAVGVTLTADDGAAVAPLANGTNRGVNPARIAGVTGTLTRAADNTYSFTRTTAGEAVPVPWPAPVLTDAMRTRRGDVTVMWWGQNDGTNDAADIIGRQRATIEALTALDKRWLVIGLSTSSASYRAPMEAQFLREYGRRFINIRAHLATVAALADAGITATAQDLDDIANGVTPASLRSDDVHLNTAGYNQVAKAVAGRLTELEWI